VTDSEPTQLPPVPDDRGAAAMFTAHRLNDVRTQLAHASGHMRGVQASDGEIRQYHSAHLSHHVEQAMNQAARLKDHVLAHYPDEASEWTSVNTAMHLAVSVSPAAKAASFAHLLQTIMYDGAHADRHAKSMLTGESDAERDFDAEHADKHLRGAQEHTDKLAEHIRDNYPDEAGWLGEPERKEDLSTISGQAREFGSQKIMRTSNTISAQTRPAGISAGFLNAD